MGIEMDKLVREAYAKINLGLDVVGRLENGYHLVRMIMQTVGIRDVITLEKIPAGVELILEPSAGAGKPAESPAGAGPAMEPSSGAGRIAEAGLAMEPPSGAGQTAKASAVGLVPAGQDNLACRAARLLQEADPACGGVRITLQKNIPVAAGMAGGSTDAAAVLKGLNELYSLGIGEERLRELGLRIGADVPYCLMGGTALAEGIGERLTALPPAPDCVLLAAKPDISVSTQYVYEHLDRAGVREHPDIDGMAAAIREGSLEGVASRLGNVLEQVTGERHPVIRSIRERMLAMGAMGALMSGSGPTVFGIFEKEGAARAAGEDIRRKGLADREIFVTGFVPAEK